MTPEQAEAVDRMLTHYEKRVEKNARTYKVEVHIPLDDLRVILRIARVAVLVAGGVRKNGRGEP